VPKPLIFANYPDSLKLITPFDGPARGVIQFWHDGDTVWLWLDARWGMFLFLKIRLRGVNAPELTKPGGKEALAFIAQLAPADTCVAITDSVKIATSGVQDRSEDRYVARLILADGHDLSQIMLDSGHAVVARE
jgi:endonuclease YncB( thermonuclease family)